MGRILLLFSALLTAAPVVAEIPLAFEPGATRGTFVARSSRFAAWIRGNEVAVVARQSLIANDGTARNPALALAKRPAAATQTDLIRLRWRAGGRTRP